MAEPFRVGLLVFPEITQLDLTGPWEVFSGLPDTEVRLVWKEAGIVRANKGLGLLADTAFAACPQLDLVCVPGGPGMNALLTDDAVLDFLRRQAEGARYVTSVCTGALVLGAAGLLRGRRSACHWSSRGMLADFGAIACDDRVVRDGRFWSGGGVTAGIDFALAVAAELHGEAVAQASQLQIEYDPDPPFRAGRPETAPPAVLARVRERSASNLAIRRAQVERAAARLGEP